MYTGYIILIKKINKLLGMIKAHGVASALSQTLTYLKEKLCANNHRSVQTQSSVSSVPKAIKFNEDILFPLVAPIFDDINVSIIIPVYNQWEYTAQCINSIIKSVKNINYEIILADDCSTDETEDADRFLTNIRIVKTKVNSGFLLNCNNAAKNSRAKYIVLLNNDTIVHENWLNSLVETAESSPDIGLVGSKLLYEDGTLQEAGGIVWRDGSAWNYGNGHDPSSPEYNYLKEVDYISGASILIRYSCWEQLGGFDTRYVPAYYEDTDIAFSIANLGFKVLYQPKSVVTHFEGKSHGKDLDKGVKAFQKINQKKFKEKWRDKLQNEHLANGQCVFNARDKSLNRRTILIIDHYVPWYDKDAGSRSVYMYIKLFVDLGYNVKFIGDNYYPHQPYTDELESIGVEVLHGSFYAKNWKVWFKLHHSSIDLVYLHRPHIAVKYIDFIRQYINVKVLYQCVDLHHIRMQRSAELTGCNRTRIEAASWKVKELELFNKSDIGLTFSHDEKIYLESLNLKCSIEQIPLFIYEEPKDSLPFANFKGRNDFMFVGGFNHSPNAEGVLWFINEVLPLVRMQIPDVKFHIIGSDMPDEIKSFESEYIINHGYLLDKELKAIYSTVKVNILPLLHGAGVKGKLVESLYYGTPFVSTSIGLEGLNTTKYKFESYDDATLFCDEIVSLLNNEEYWHSHRNRQKEIFSDQFLITKVSDKLLKVF
jgi:GT2 family glycosyltransferase